LAGSDLDPLRPRVKVRHLVLSVLCLMYFIAYIDRVNIAVAGPAIRRELGLSATELGLIFSAFAYPYAAMQIAGGWLSDRFGPRIVLALLSLIWALATVLTGVSWSVASLVGFRVLVGLGEGGAFPAATRALTFWMPAAERGFAQGITHSFARLGGAVTPPIVIAIVAAYGWREAFVALGLLSAIWTAVWLATFRDAPAAHPWMGAPELAELGVTPQGAGRRATPWKDLLSRMWLVTFVDFCYGWSLWVFLTWLPSYLSEARGFHASQMALASMLPLGAGVVGDTLGGVISDTIFRRTGNLRLARRAMLVTGLSGALVFLPPAAFTSSPVAAVCYLALAFFFLELTNAVLWALPLDIGGPYAGTAAGIMNTGFGIAGTISPVVFGIAIDRTGRYEIPFLLSSGLLVVGVIGSLFIDPTRKVLEPGTVTALVEGAAL
jgi:ACS family D-galactonate transporter-like MFS transporter